MPTAAEINAYVNNVLSMSISDSDKASIIAEAAAAYGVSNEQISAATGYSQAAVDAYLAPAQAAPEPVYYEPPAPVYEPPAPVYYEPPAPINEPPVTTSQEGAMPTNAEINAFVTDVLTQSISDDEKAQIIADAAAQYGVSNAQIAAATGYDVQTVNDYLVVAQNPLIANWHAAYKEVSTAPSTYISNQEINAFVTDVLAQSGTSDAEKAAIINQAAVQYGVSNADIAIATGYDLTVVNEYLKPSTATGVAYRDIDSFIDGVLADTSLNDAQRATKILDAAATYGVSNQDIVRATGFDLETVTNYLALASNTAETQAASTAAAAAATAAAAAAAAEARRIAEQKAANDLALAQQKAAAAAAAAKTAADAAAAKERERLAALAAAEKQRLANQAAAAKAKADADAKAAAAAAAAKAKADADAKAAALARIAEEAKKQFAQGKITATQLQKAVTDAEGAQREADAITVAAAPQGNLLPILLAAGAYFLIGG